MSLEAKVTQDLKAAMKAKDDAAKRGIRAIKSAILLLKTDGSGNEITEEIEIKLLQKLVKQRKESFEIFKKEGREELAQKEQEEISIIEKYLPKQMDEATLTGVLEKIIAETGASSMRDLSLIHI